MKSSPPLLLRLSGPILGGAALLCLSGADGCPPPAGLPVPPAIGGASDFVGADVCLGCHADIHRSWADSKHARAAETLRSAGRINRAECLPCHTTAYGRGGFVSDLLTPKFGGVQCESCHGAGARHVGSRRPQDIVGAPTAAVCRTCHFGPEQPNYEEWSESAHARALNTLRNDPAAANSCLPCHSSDYDAAARRNEVRALRGLPPQPLPDIEDADPSNDPREPVGCLSCHAAHGAPHRAELRDAPTAACARCHIEPDPSPGRVPHAPQMNMLTARGGRRLRPDSGPGTAALIGVPVVHSAMDALGGCARCHGPNVKVESPTAIRPNQTGHRFEVTFDSCTPCHTIGDAAALLVTANAEIGDRVAVLRRRAVLLRDSMFFGEPARGWLDAALLNLDLVERDGSGGVHNTGYARALLDAADALLSAIENRDQP